MPFRRLALRRLQAGVAGTSKPWCLRVFSATSALSARDRSQVRVADDVPAVLAFDPCVTSTSFGVVSSQANPPRQVRFGVKALW